MGLVDFGLQGYQSNRVAGLQRDAQLAQNAYSRFLSQDRGTRQLADLNRNMERGLQGFASFGKRGLQNSGIFNQAQSDYAQNWTRQQQSITDQMLQAGREADMQDANAWMRYDATTGNNSENNYNTILQTAYDLQKATGV
jgi:hypothetical protein